MSNIIPIWTPQDSIDTARQFHLELDNARKGVEIADPVKMRAAFDPEFMFRQSRERRARLMDALAVVLLFLLMGALGAACLLMVAPKAKAEEPIDPTAVSFAAHFADAICGTLTKYPTSDGVQGILSAIQDRGLTNLQAAGAVVLAVSDVCPAQQHVLEKFADRWAAIEEKTV